MSYNNYLDCDAAYSAACDLAEPACVIVKHTNPCGVAARADLREAYRLAVRADPTSAFGGIVAFNRCVFGLSSLTSCQPCGSLLGPSQGHVQAHIREPVRQPHLECLCLLV